MKIALLLIFINSFWVDRGEVLKRVNNPEQSIFLNAIWNHAEQVESVPLEITLSICILESRFGQSKEAKLYNNYFNTFECGILKEYKCIEDCFLDFQNINASCQYSTAGDWLYYLSKTKGKAYSKKIEKILLKFKLYL